MKHLSGKTDYTKLYIQYIYMSTHYVNHKQNLAEFIYIYWLSISSIFSYAQVRNYKCANVCVVYYTDIYAFW